jgi:hypothetical protein
LGVVSGGKMEFHVQDYSEGPEEMGNEFRTTIRGNMRRNSVLGEYMEDKEFRKFEGGNSIVGGDEYRLLGKSVYNNEDGSEAGGDRELFYEIHGDRIPWFVRDWELLDESIWTMSFGFRPSACGTGVAVIGSEGAETGPDIFMSYKFDCLVLSEVTGDRMIMLELEDSKAEIVGVQDIDPIVQE